MRHWMDKPVQRMCRELLRPLARILLRAGMTYAEFEELSKSTFVDVASGEYGKHGRPANVSRVAIITGMSRREVRRYRDRLAEELKTGSVQGDARYWSPASRVLSGWHQDADFTDGEGRPLSLPLEGASASFESLLKRYCGDIPRGAMASELERVGAVVIESERARVLTRNYVSSDQSAEVLEMVGTFLRDFTSTLDFNLQVGAGENPWFQRLVYNSRLKPTALKLFKRLVARDGQAWLEELDTWLSAHEVADDGDDPVRAGMGIYYFQDRARTRSYKMTWSESLQARSAESEQAPIDTVAIGKPQSGAVT